MARIVARSRLQCSRNSPQEPKEKTAGSSISGPARRCGNGRKLEITMTNPAVFPSPDHTSPQPTWAPVISGTFLRSLASPNGCWSAASAKPWPPAAIMPIFTSSRSPQPRWAWTSKSSNPPARAPAPDAVSACSRASAPAMPYTDNLSPERLLHAARTAALIASGPAKQPVQGFTEAPAADLYPVPVRRFRSRSGRSAGVDSARPTALPAPSIRASCRCAPVTLRSCAAS